MPEHLFAPLHAPHTCRVLYCQQPLVGARRWVFPSVTSLLLRQKHLPVLTGTRCNLGCFRSAPLPPRPRSRSRDSGDENDNIQERHFRPHFLQAPGDLIVQEGRLCRMDCKVNTASFSHTREVKLCGLMTRVWHTMPRMFVLPVVP